MSNLLMKYITLIEEKKKLSKVEKVYKKVSYHFILII